MQFKATQFEREGVIHSKGTVEEVFPLLCPKREEEWIPGWECETIWSKSGYNEEGAIFCPGRQSIRAGIIQWLSPF